MAVKLSKDKPDKISKPCLDKKHIKCYSLKCNCYCHGPNIINKIPTQAYRQLSKDDEKEQGK